MQGQVLSTQVKTTEMKQRDQRDAVILRTSEPDLGLQSPQQTPRNCQAKSHLSRNLPWFAQGKKLSLAAGLRFYFAQRRRYWLYSYSRVTLYHVIEILRHVQANQNPNRQLYRNRALHRLEV